MAADPYRTRPTEPFVICTGEPDGTGDLIESVQALDLQTGKTIWKTTVPRDIYAKTMAVGSGRIVVFNNNGELYCLAADTGEALWSARIERRTSGNVGRARVYILGPQVLVLLDGVFACFDLDGNQRWSRISAISAMGNSTHVLEFDG